MRTLKRGMRGKDVGNLQYYLGIKADDSFGPITENAVKKKQTSLGLTSNGIATIAVQKAFGLSDFRVFIFNKEDIWFAGAPYSAVFKPLKTLSQWSKDEDADLVFNLAFFNSRGTGSDEYGVIRGRTLTYLRAKGIDVGYGGTEEKITTSSGNICAGYKVGIKDGIVKGNLLRSKRARNANGLLKNGKYFHIQSVIPVSELAIVKHMKDNFDVDIMFIQDSGGSVGVYDSRRRTHLAAEKEGVAGRAVASVACYRGELGGYQLC